MYAAFGRGDVQTILDHLTDDVEWTLEGPASFPFSGKRIGKQQVRGFFEALGGTQTDMKLLPEQFVAQGDHVAMFGRFSATVAATGESYDSPIAHLFTLRDGKVCRYVNLTNTAAMAAAYPAASAMAR